MVGKQPVRSVASKSLGSRTVMRIFLVLLFGAGGGSEVTGKSGVGSRVGAGGHVDLTIRITVIEPCDFLATDLTGCFPTISSRG